MSACQAVMDKYTRAFLGGAQLTKKKVEKRRRNRRGQFVTPTQIFEKHLDEFIQRYNDGLTYKELAAYFKCRSDAAAFVAHNLQRKGVIERRCNGHRDLVEKAVSMVLDEGKSQIDVVKITGIARSSLNRKVIAEREYREEMAMLEARDKSDHDKKN